MPAVAPVTYRCRRGPAEPETRWSLRAGSLFVERDGGEAELPLSELHGVRLWARGSSRRRIYLCTVTAPSGSTTLPSHTWEPGDRRMSRHAAWWFFVEALCHEAADGPATFRQGRGAGVWMLAPALAITGRWSWFRLNRPATFDPRSPPELYRPSGGGRPLLEAGDPDEHRPDPAASWSEGFEDLQDD